MGFGLPCPTSPTLTPLASFTSAFAAFHLSLEQGEESSQCTSALHSLNDESEHVRPVPLQRGRERWFASPSKLDPSCFSSVDSDAATPAYLRSRVPSIESLSSFSSELSASTISSALFCDTSSASTSHYFSALGSPHHGFPLSRSTSRFTELDPETEVEIELPLPLDAPQLYAREGEWMQIHMPEQHHLNYERFHPQPYFGPTAPQLDYFPHSASPPHPLPCQHFCACPCSSIWQTSPDPAYLPRLRRPFFGPYRRDRWTPLGPSPSNKKAELYKTELCRSWIESGYCRYEGKCQFAHGYGELRQRGGGGRARSASAGPALYEPTSTNQEYASSPPSFGLEAGSRGRAASSPAYLKGSTPFAEPTLYEQYFAY